eukprot:TRINITY_DN3414_c0_g1_i1.p1 TRINITY_DN3414_c0_g1~~TRINITY_DN3414_c0_g1_i1.p1  ORF type:complete len:598 (-),score=111.98 TRINITY_DN3414_c0_g1_i1:37-1830(-)
MADHGHSHSHGGHQRHSHSHDDLEETHEVHPAEQAPTSDIPVVKDLFYAANIGDMELLRQFIEEEKVDINSKGDDDVTALHWAAYKGHFEIARYLVEHGAEIDVPNRSELHTPLMWACIGGYIRIVYFLLQHGADVNKVDSRGYNALHHAVQYNQTVIAHFLMEKGLLIDSRDNEGHTALLWAAYTNHEDAVRYVLSQGADINAQDNGGCTALHWGAAKGNMGVVKTLLANGKINPSLRDKEGLTPAQAAEKKAHFKIARTLREAEKLGTNATPLSEKSLGFLWFFVALIGIQYLFFVLSNFPNFLAGLVIVIASLYGIRRLLGHLWLDANHRNPLWSGVVVSAYAASFYAYWTSIYWATHHYTGSTYFFVALNLVYIPLYIKLLRSDPGSIKSSSGSSLNEWMLYVSALQKDDPLPQFCLTCMVRKPIRAKHCRSCGFCVARFDHHCGWINNCVGIGNHVPFLICLVIVIANHILFLRFSALALASLHEAPPFFPANHSIPFYFSNEPLIVVLFFFHAGNVFWQSYLLYSLLQQVRVNTTTNEVINGGRYDYLRDPQNPAKFKNPFDRGLQYNVKDIVDPAIDWYHLYHVPKWMYS